MFLGFLTAPFRDQGLKEVVRFAAENGFSGLEVATGIGQGHIDAGQVVQDKGRSVRRILKGSGVQITSLARYVNLLDPDPDKRRALINEIKTVIDAAEVLEVPVVCTMGGFPLPGKSKMHTIEEEVPKVFPEICRHAEARGVRIALENWYMTNLQGLHHFQRFFEVAPFDNLGLNFDPSHLVHQDIDYIAATERFGARIFHCHAKDTEILWHRRRWVGNYEGGWWRYVIPGFGVIEWGRFISALRNAGYDGVLSIEHEDSAFPVELGFLKGRDFLKQYL
ncbi:MAG: sugar phosphate isomerase/epimerase [Armatimonadetes bacterium]|nr:sugar phosphate isomerase/epimerase [Armatimonadota bacterium]MDW8120860.1 sugar phosphate isomerase/epimerase [Armatimonadota bacterium]